MDFCGLIQIGLVLRLGKIGLNLAMVPICLHPVEVAVHGIGKRYGNAF